MAAPDSQVRPTTAEISLGHGRVAIIDVEDLALVTKHKWHSQPSLSGSFYAVASTGSKRLLPMHRLICPAPSGMEVDHVDGNTLNNRRANLRLATRAQNSRNRRAQDGGTSKYKGVSAKGERWAACIGHGGESVHLGTFDTEEAAARQYDRAARWLHGRFARTNEMIGLLPSRRKVA